MATKQIGFTVPGTEEKPTDKKEPVLTEIELEIDKILMEKFVPVDNMADANFTLTTTEIYRKLCSFLPSDEIFMESQVFKSLHRCNFKTITYGNMRIVWMLKGV